MLMPELCLSMIRTDKPFKSYVTGQARRSQHSNMLNCNNKKINIQADGFMVITPQKGPAHYLLNLHLSPSIVSGNQLKRQ